MRNIYWLTVIVSLSLKLNRTDYRESLGSTFWGYNYKIYTSNPHNFLSYDSKMNNQKSFHHASLRIYLSPHWQYLTDWPASQVTGRSGEPSI